MAPAIGKQRRDTPSTQAGQHPLRVVACGTLFLTHTLSLASYPEPSAIVRAHSVTRARGGSAGTCLSILAQFQSVDALLVAPLGGNEEGRTIISDLEREGISTKFCKVWEQSGVPSAWVLHAGEFPSLGRVSEPCCNQSTQCQYVEFLFRSSHTVRIDTTYVTNPRFVKLNASTFGSRRLLGRLILTTVICSERLTRLLPR